MWPEEGESSLIACFPDVGVEAGAVIGDGLGARVGARVGFWVEL